MSLRACPERMTAPLAAAVTRMVPPVRRRAPLLRRPARNTTPAAMLDGRARGTWSAARSSGEHRHRIGIAGAVASLSLDQK
jgi:hypothetical protein